MNSKEHTTKFTLFILSLSQFFGLSLWFAPNAVFNQLKPIFDLNDTDLSLISIAIIAGFILGSLLSALLNLPDVLQGQVLFFFASIIGGISNALVIISSGFTQIWILRFLTGLSLAGIYPVGMKLTASHFRSNRGLAIGTLLAALTAGSGLPYLFNIFGAPDWKLIIITVTILALTSGTMVFVFINEGPYVGKNGSFKFSAIKEIYSNRSVLFANIGYFGHMWELYPFWVWIPVFLNESYVSKFPDTSPSESLFFVSIGSFFIFFCGAIANAIGGYYSDKFGRANFNIIALTISGLSGLFIGFFYSKPYIALIIALIWGIAIVPDSPQYSTLVSEHADQDLVGTALTIQTAIGFTITMVSVRLLPIILDTLSWSRVFMILPVGPLIGILAMYKLKKNSKSNQVPQTTN